MNSSRRRNILLISVIVTIIVLVTLIYVYLSTSPGVFYAIVCNNVINIKSCSENADTTTVENTLLPDTTNSQLDENVFITIEPVPDDSFLDNPGIGWQYDINENSDYFPETVAYSNRQEIGWKILNPAEGLYNWSALDSQLSEAVSAGKKYSFRVYTMAGESFGSHKVPAWVLEKGALILPSGEPDYSNCVYQEEWGKFVQELISRYDGNPNIAFVDISGYGNFNEWSWQDTQTQWDDLWEASYTAGTAGSETMSTIDSQARRRLVDIFIGGDFAGHQCRDENGMIQTLNYSYQGFVSTQLVMPYAGIVQSTQYVLTRRSDVGFRYDSLGRNSNSDVSKISEEISQIWQNAPVVYEFTNPDELDFEFAVELLDTTHASLIHNNEYSQSKANLQKLLLNVGYRYVLRSGWLDIQPYPKGKMDVSMVWQNIGVAPSYPKMKQDFRLYFYIVDQAGNVVADYPIQGDISAWMPASSSIEPAPDYEIHQTLTLPPAISPNTYNLMVSIIDVTTGRPLNLAFTGNDGTGKYYLAKVDILSEGDTP